MKDFQNLFKKELHTSNCLYTDGSKVPDLSYAGFAIYGQNDSLKCRYRTAGFVSSFCVETMAILTAIEIIQSKNWTVSTIFTDSKSALSAINSPFVAGCCSYLILKIKQLIKMSVDSGKTINIIWIPSHKGIIGNETADELAKDAIRNGVDTQIGIPLNKIKNFWKKDSLNDFLTWCRQEGNTRGSFYCHNYLTESKHIWFHNCSVKRRTITSINRLRSGHTSLRSSLFRFDIIDSPLCEFCGSDEETPNHIFWACPSFTKQRNSLIIELSSLFGHMPIPIESLLTTNDTSIIYALDKFINSINKFI